MSATPLGSSSATAPASDADAALAVFEALAIEAGRAILDVRARGFRAEWKPDDSPVTEADRRAEAIVLEGLRRLWPDIPIVAEEEVAAGRKPASLESCFFLVDALDGTREFLRGGDDFTVNIALVDEGAPVLGVVYAPATRILYLGRPERAERAELDPEGRPGPMRTLDARCGNPVPVLLASRSHRTPQTNAFLARYAGAEIVSIGSSVKFGWLAEGAAHLYPRLWPTMEWDTAAGDAVLRAAGGMTVTEDGAPLRYGKRGGQGLRDFENPFFIARGAIAPPVP